MKLIFTNKMVYQFIKFNLYRNIAMKYMQKIFLQMEQLESACSMSNDITFDL